MAVIDMNNYSYCPHFDEDNSDSLTNEQVQELIDRFNADEISIEELCDALM